jgi:NAD(P)-dependent dehydrogenase (short-subunit alcohol dehydrogenase family)
MKRFEGRTAVVTGGAMGLGAAVARRLSDEGARVVIVDLDAARAEALIGDLDGFGHAFIRADLTRAGAADEVAQATAEIVADVHALVNNAGISRPMPVAALTPRNWEEQVAVNLYAPLELTRAFIPLMRDRSAAIVNVSSERAFNTGAGSPVYDITKAGLGALTRSSASELWEYGIRVNEIAPGGMVTEMHFGTGPDAEERKRELERLESPAWIIKRLAQPTEVAAAVAFLASPDASFITATTLHVNGGMALG